MSFPSMSSVGHLFVNSAVLGNQLHVDLLNGHVTSNGRSDEKLVVGTDAGVQERLLCKYRFWELEVLIQVRQGFKA